MKTAIIFHEVKPGVPCPDGVMAAAIANLKYPDAEVLGDSYRNDADYGNSPDVAGLNIGKGDRLIIVDFSYPAQWLRWWNDQGVDVVVIDHHESKFPMLAGFAGAILDANECGATLAWKTFFPDVAMPEVLVHVRRRDIGADGYYKSPENCRDSKAITAAMSAFRAGKNLALQISLCKNWLTYPDPDWLLETGQHILDEEEKRVAAIAATAVESKLCGYRCGKVQTLPEDDRLASQIGNAIALAHPEWDFAWIVASDGIGNSLRSSNGFDVSQVASQMGGGGHKAASGFSLKSA